MSETLTHRNLGLLKDSINYDFQELVDENTVVSCFIKLSKIPFRELLSNCKKMTYKTNILHLNLHKLTLSQLFFNEF